MRSRAEILDDGLRAIQKPSTHHQSYIKVTLLTLEVFVDIRDELSVIKKDLVDLNEYLSDHA